MRNERFVIAFDEKKRKQLCLKPNPKPYKLLFVNTQIIE